LEYLHDLHGQNAAIRAGYSERTARSIASENLTKPNIAAAIAVGLALAAMPTVEVLARLADHARGDMSDFLRVERVAYHPRQAIADPTPENPQAVRWVEDPQAVERLVISLDMEQARDRGMLHLIKRLKWDKHGDPDLELYNAQIAQALLAKIQGLLVEKTEISGPSGGPIEIDDARDQLADKLTRRLAPRDPDADPGGDSGAAPG
jgi:phage terminase small subunit